RHTQIFPPARQKSSFASRSNVLHAPPVTTHPPGGAARSQTCRRRDGRSTLPCPSLVPWPQVPFQPLQYVTDAVVKLHISKQLSAITVPGYRRSESTLRRKELLRGFSAGHLPHCRWLPES